MWLVVFLTRFMKFSFFATKSVSEFTSLIVAILLSLLTNTSTRPSLARRSAFLAALPRPFSRKISTAALISPFASSRAFLQSIIPAPVLSRNSFTICAEISAIINPYSSSLIASSSTSCFSASLIASSLATATSGSIIALPSFIASAISLQNS